MTKSFTGTGAEQQDKERQRTDLLSQVESIQGQIFGLGSAPKISTELSNLLSQKNRNEQLVAKSLNIAGNLSKSRFFRSLASRIKAKVSQGFFVSSTRSKSGSVGNGRRSSSFSVTFGRLTQGLDQLVQKQQEIDLQKFESERAALQGQLAISQSNLSLFQQQDKTAKDLLKRETNAVARLKKKRGRISLRTKGSRTNLFDDETETTQTLLS